VQIDNTAAMLRYDARNERRALCIDSRTPMTVGSIVIRRVLAIPVESDRLQVTPTRTLITVWSSELWLPLTHTDFVPPLTTHNTIINEDVVEPTSSNRRHDYTDTMLRAKAANAVCGRHHTDPSDSTHERQTAERLHFSTELDDVARLSELSPLRRSL
jgi:hypothetical protein